MNYEINNNSTHNNYITENEFFINGYEDYRPYMVPMPPCMYCVMNQLRFYRPTYLLTLPEIQSLKGKKIRITVPNIPGTITAEVGEYNSTTNRVELKNIVSDRTGINYGNLTYLPEELSGLKVLDGQDTSSGETGQGSGDCTVTGGKGKFIDSGGGSKGVLSVTYTIHECEIEITPKVVGIVTERYILNRRNNRIEVKWPTSPVTRYVFRAWIENKSLWVEIELQHRTLTGKWRRTGGGKTKLGSWNSLKF